jgi:hypothetical protein
MMENIREEIEADVKSTYVEEYKELLSTWRDLERKAQNTVALAGIFLGGAMAFVRNLSADSSEMERILLLVTILLLSISLLSCVFVLKTRKISSPPTGESVKKIADALYKIPLEELTVERYIGFNRDQTGVWETVNNEIFAANKDKAKYLWMAQLFIILSLIIVSITAIFNIFLGW